MSAFSPQSGEAKALVGTLTMAQRRAVRTGRLVRGRGYWPLRHALWEKGLFTTAALTDVLTPLGHEVQAELRGGA